jgi:hypothetical protein
VSTPAAGTVVPKPPASPPSDVACEVLRRALTLVLLDVDGWDQTAWGVRRTDPTTGACRTAYCLAGHVAVHVVGCPPVWTPGVSTASGDGRAFLQYVRFTEPDRDGEPHTWERGVGDVAEEALELTVARADLLFDEGRSLRRLVELAYAFTGGRVDLLADYVALVGRRPDVGRRDAALDARLGDAASRLVAEVTARGEDHEDGFPLEDRLGDDRAWWEDELDAAVAGLAPPAEEDSGGA